MAEEIEVPLEALIEKEPITVILSQKGWIRSLKGHVSLTDEFKFKDDDALQIALHAQTTDKLVIMDSSGNSSTLQPTKSRAEEGSDNRCG